MYWNIQCEKRTDLQPKYQPVKIGSDRGLTVSSSHKSLWSGASCSPELNFILPGTTQNTYKQVYTCLKVTLFKESSGKAIYDFTKQSYQTHSNQAIKDYKSYICILHSSCDIWVPQDLPELKQSTENVMLSTMMCVSESLPHVATNCMRNLRRHSKEFLIMSVRPEGKFPAMGQLRRC